MFTSGWEQRTMTPFNTEDDVKRSSNGDQRAAAYARLQNAASENIFGSAISNKGNYRPGKKDDDSEDSGASEGEKEVITISDRKYPYEGWYDICI